MQIRTYLRIMFNFVFKNNIICKFINYIVKFYCDLDMNGSSSLKFSQEMPLSYSEAKKNIFFQSIAGDRIDCK